MMIIFYFETLPEKNNPSNFWRILKEIIKESLNDLLEIDNNDQWKAVKALYDNDGIQN